MCLCGQSIFTHFKPSQWLATRFCYANSTNSCDTFQSKSDPKASASRPVVILHCSWNSLQGGVKSVYPTQLKSLMGRCNNTFMGSQQQDSHELMDTLVDALAEDLNRVQNKQCIQVSCY